MGDLSTNFSRSEFKCKCGCGASDVKPAFIEKLQKARDIAGVSFKITSGVRCIAHNKAEESKDSSSHVDGLAADIACSDSPTRCAILKSLIMVGFNRIGIADTFIHVDYDLNKPKDVIWTY